VDTGLGNRFSDVIEINKNLKNYPQLHDVVLKHELSHTDQAFTIKDLKLDLGKSEVNSLDMLKFMIKYPKSFTQLLPFYYSKKHGFVYDINLMLIYSVTLCLFSFISFIAFRL
jgi:hypothetical protein